MLKKNIKIMSDFCLSPDAVDSLTEILVGEEGEGRKEKSALYDFPDFQELTVSFRVVEISTVD